MKKLLFKEYRLCFNTVTLFFLPFVFMTLIPNYPYLVAFFFACNSIFYSFAQAAVDNDLLFSSMLPVSKADVVRSKCLFVVSIQAVYFLVFIPVLFLSHSVHPEGNSAGVDACLSLLGEGLIVYAIFNSVFLPRFFKNSHKVGSSFLASVIAMFAWIAVAEGFMIACKAASRFVPLFAWISENIGSFPISASAWAAQCVYFSLCAILYAVLTVFACRRAIGHFEKVNL